MGRRADRPITARDQDVRDEIVASGGRSLMVEAAAGTGKTTLLVDRILRSVRDGTISLARTVAITFTEKAAGELESRLRSELAAELSRPDLPADERAALAVGAEELDRAAISTIHGFCARILRERAVEAGVDPEFSVMDAAAGDLLRERCWHEWLQEQVSAAPDELGEVLRAGVSAADLREVAFALAGTPEVVEEIDAWLAVPDDDLPALTERVRRAVPDAAHTCEAGLTGRTNPNSRAWRRQTAAMARGLADDSAVRRAAYALAAAPLEEALKSFDRSERDAVRAALAPLADAARALGAFVAGAACRLLVGFVQHYRGVKMQRSVLDFQDLLLRAGRLLRDDRAVRAYFQRRFDAVFVDEFQDTDPLQAELIAYLCEDPGATPADTMADVALAEGKLFAVGDPKQSIYRFRRADVQIYDRFKRLFEPARGLRRIACNFRATPALLDWCNEQFEVLLQPGRDPAVYQAEHVPLEPPLGAAQPPGPAVVGVCPPPGMVTDDWHAEDARRHEAHFLARFVRDWTSGGAHGDWRCGDFAFLFRALVDVDIYADALEEFGIPHRIVGGRHFYQREQVVETLTLLQAIEDPLDEAAVVGALRSSFWGFSDEDLLRHRSAGGGWNYLADRTDAGLAEAFARMRRWHAARNRSAPHVLLRDILAVTGARAAFLRKPAGAQRAANLDKLADHLRLLWPAAGNFGAVIRHLSALQEADLPEEESSAVEPGDDFVQLISMHKAKGLEFPAVVLPDLARGLGGRGGAPSLVMDRVGERAAVQLRKGLATGDYADLADAEAANGRAESRRLLYVACTRAERLLVLPLYWQASRGDADSSFQAMLQATGHLPAPGDVPFGTDAGGVHFLDVVAWTREGSPRRPAAGGSESGTPGLVRDRERWLGERHAAQARSLRLGHFVLPSLLDVDRGHPDFAQEGGLGGRAFGTLFHDLMADAPFGLQEPVRLQTVLHGLAQAHAARLGMDEVAAGEAAELALAALANPEFEALLAGATAVRREVPFAVPLGALGMDGSAGAGLAEGSIDLLLAGPQGSVVLDYKTDRVGPGAEADLARSYWPQLALYALAVGACGDGRAPDVALFFVRTGRLLRRDVDRDLAAAVASLAVEQAS